MRQSHSKKQSLTLLQAFDGDNEQFRLRVGKDRSIHSYNIMVRARSYVADYLVSWENRKDIPLASLQLEFIQRFSVYLSVERQLRGGTIWLACMMLKGVVQRAYRRGQLSCNPFAEFHIAKNIRERQFLTEEELNRLMHFHFADSMQAYVRDVFVFSALTGMSYIDIRHLRRKDIRLINHHYWIISTRHKTGIPFKVKLLEQAHIILQRYTSEDREVVFDRCGYHAIAKRLQRILKETGIPKHITFHCARHTFAVMALNHGMAIESVSRILGHSNINTTQIYARVTMKKLDADFARLESGLTSVLCSTQGKKPLTLIRKPILLLLHLLKKRSVF